MINIYQCGLSSFEFMCLVAGSVPRSILLLERHWRLLLVLVLSLMVVLCELLMVLILGSEVQFIHFDPVRGFPPFHRSGH